MTIEVRHVRPEELEEAGLVTAESYREFAPRGDDDWSSYLERLADAGERNRRATVLVAVEEGRILGSVTLELDERIDDDHEELEDHEAHVRMLAVIPEARGRGIGRALMDACLDESRRAGKSVLTLNTTERMRAAQRMYEGMGFSRGEDWVLPDGFRLLSYSLDLSAGSAVAGEAASPGPS